MCTFTRNIIVLAALLPLGCSTPPYLQTPPVSGTKAMVELPWYEGGFPNLHIHKIDDVYTPTIAKKFDVTAGEHEVILSCQYTGAFGTRAYFGRQLLKFTAQADHVYQVRIDKVDKKHCDIALIDKSTKTVVSQVIIRQIEYTPR